MEDYFAIFEKLITVCFYEAHKLCVLSSEELIETHQIHDDFH